MSKIIKDVKVVSGSYKYQGQDKKIYTKVGIGFIEGDKISIKLEKWFNPAGIEGDCFLNLFEPFKKESNGNRSINQVESDQIPF